MFPAIYLLPILTQQFRAGEILGHTVAETLNCFLILLLPPSLVTESKTKRHIS